MSVTIRKTKGEKTQLPFASADKIARSIAKELADRDERISDKTMHPRLTLAVSEWLKSPDLGAYSPSLSEFSFTDPGQPIRQIWQVHFEMDDLHDGDRVLTIPAFNPQTKIVAPEVATGVLCFGKLAVIDLLTGKTTCIVNFPTIISEFKNTHPQERRYRVKTINKRENLTVIRMALYFHRQEGNSKPVRVGITSGILAAIYRK